MTNFRHLCDHCVSSLSAEVLELAGNAARVMKRRRLQPCHIYRAIACDQELHDVRLLRFILLMT